MQENNSIGYYIINTNKLIGRYIISNFEHKLNCKISPMQVMIMNYLLNNQKKIVVQQDICNTFNLRRSTVSGIVKTMEKNNIIIRNESKEDPRKKEIRLTKVFIENTNKIKKEFTDVETILESNFTAEEKALLISLLKKLSGNLIEEEKKKNV